MSPLHGDPRPIFSDDNPEGHSEYHCQDKILFPPDDISSYLTVYRLRAYHMVAISHLLQLILKYPIFLASICNFTYHTLKWWFQADSIPLLDAGQDVGHQADTDMDAGNQTATMYDEAFDNHQNRVENGNGLRDESENEDVPREQEDNEEDEPEAETNNVRKFPYTYLWSIQSDFSIGCTSSRYRKLTFWSLHP